MTGLEAGNKNFYPKQKSYGMLNLNWFFKKKLFNNDIRINFNEKNYIPFYGRKGIIKKTKFGGF